VLLLVKEGLQFAVQLDLRFAEKFRVLLVLVELSLKFYVSSYFVVADLVGEGQFDLFVVAELVGEGHFDL
jgi:hypothetical protein